MAYVPSGMRSDKPTGRRRAKKEEAKQKPGVVQQLKAQLLVGDLFTQLRQQARGTDMDGDVLEVCIKMEDALKAGIMDMAKQLVQARDDIKDLQKTVKALQKDVLDLKCLNHAIRSGDWQKGHAPEVNTNSYGNSGFDFAKEGRTYRRHISKVVEDLQAKYKANPCKAYQVVQGLAERFGIFENFIDPAKYTLNGKVMQEAQLDAWSRSTCWRLGKEWPSSASRPCASTTSSATSSTRTALPASSEARTTRSTSPSSEG